MTLESYDASKLDRLAMQLLDLAATARKMSQLCSEYDIETFALHDKKARQWWSNLDRWLRKARAELEMQVIEARASQRAKAAVRRGKR
jgi:hypothetical protein